MNLIDFREIIQRFTTKGILGRKLFIFIGNLQELKNELPIDINITCNVLDILDFSISQNGDDVIKKEIEKQMEKYSKELLQNNKNRIILTIVNSVILPRYKVSISGLYNYFIGDRTFVIIHFPKINEFNLEISKYFNYTENFIKNYINYILPEEHKKNIVIT